MLEFNSQHLKTIVYVWNLQPDSAFFGPKLIFLEEIYQKKNSTDFAFFFWFNQFLFSHPTVSDGFRRKVFALVCSLLRMSPHPCFSETSLSQFERWNGPGPFDVIFFGWRLYPLKWQDEMHTKMQTWNPQSAEMYYLLWCKANSTLSSKLYCENQKE